MSKGAFDKDLDDYLRARARRKVNIKGFFEKFKPKLPKLEKKVELPDEVEVYDVDSAGDVVKPVKKEKDVNVFGWLFKRRKKQEEDVEGLKFEVVSLIDDLKEVAKIALTAIKQLPDDKLSEFKKSPEFETLKKILKAHNLVK